MKVQPSLSQLRKFGLTLGGMIALFFGIILSRFGVWPWGVALLFIFWALLHPKSLKPVFVAWSAFGHVLGQVNSRIILFFVFIFIVWPMGFFMKLFKKDPMRRKFEPSQVSYRIKRDPDEDYVKRMEGPF